VADGDSSAADLADAILVGRAIDWTSAATAVGSTDPELFRQLQVLARIAEVHRDPQEADAPDTWGHLRVLDRLGAGAHGIVYRAWDPRLDREVALKLIPTANEAADGTAIVEEGRLLARVRHPNVLTIYGAEQIGDRIGLWMELVQGKTLEQLLQAGRTFTCEEVRCIGIEVGRALAAVHSAGLLHRDVKAHNVMLGDDGRVVLMDFGTGLDLGRSADPPAGTPLYLAPEIFRGKPASIRSDIYSAGVLLYRLLTGAYPVTGQTVGDLRRRHEAANVADRAALPSVPRALSRVVRRALQTDPDARYASANELASALESAGAKSWRRNTVYAAAIAASVVLVASTAGPALRGRLRDANANAGLSAALPAPAAAATPIIAVLPLANLSTVPDSDYFADGLTDEILRNLALIEGLQVRSRTSSFFFKGKPRDVADIARRLGVTHVVEGSVLRDGRRLRINTQLVQVEGDVPLWSERFDREIADVFAVQDEISRAIVNRLRLSIGQGRRRYDTNVELYDLYLRARAQLELRDIGAGAREAAALFEQIVARDPSFAPAYAGLATALAHMSNTPYTGKEHATARYRIRPAAVRALQLDPLLAEAHAAVGWMHAKEFQWADSEKSFERALELSPTDTSITISYVYATLRALGKASYAERLLRQALTHDPLSLDAARELGSVLVESERYTEALQLLEPFRRNPDTVDLRADRDLVRALTFLGRHEEAVAIATTRYVGDGTEQWRARPLIGLGRREEVQALARKHQAYPFRAAIIQAALGDEDGALSALERMFEGEAQRLAILLMQPELRSLRQNPRWTALRRKLNIPADLPVQADAEASDPGRDNREGLEERSPR
jgi:TolB-like protein/Tfp pilus assembly protein PilF